MTIENFITKAWNGETKAKACSSVFKEGEGDKVAIYSYGYHYPLLFRVDGKAVRNVRGYSNSTGRHITWSRGVEAIDIAVPRGFRLSWDDGANLEALKKGQDELISSIKETMASKRRKDTAVYRYLSDRLEYAEKQLELLLK